MNVTRFADAPEYQAPNHYDMLCQRLQGREAGPAVQLWLGVSTVQPGGHTGLDGSPMEKHYVVLEGELVLVGELDGQRQEAVLSRFDSCRFAPGERRQLVNRSAQPARVLLAMPFEPPPAAKPVDPAL
jgi:hypothetical protein